jgi:hypothetical protein
MHGWQVESLPWCLLIHAEAFLSLNMRLMTWRALASHQTLPFPAASARAALIAV